MGPEEIAQQALKNAPPADTPAGIIYWIGIGVVLAFLAGDKLFFWVQRWRTIYRYRANGNVKDKTKTTENGRMPHPECALLGQDVRRLTEQVEHLVNRMDLDRDDLRKTMRLVNEMHGWHAPDEHGNQNWRNYSVVEAIHDMRGMLKSHINDFNQTIRDHGNRISNLSRDIFNKLDLLLTTIHNQHK